MRSIPHTPIFGIFLETFNLKINVLLIIVLGMVLVFFTSLATTVHAKESVPPSPPETFPSEEIETIEADVAADQLAEETPDEVDPVQENTPAPEADFPPPPPEDASGEADPDVAFDASGASDVEQLSSDAISPGVESEPAEEAEPVEQILPEQSPVIPDPYFFVGGTKHSFLPEGGDCAGAENCTVSTTPIQDVLNAVSGGLTPDDSTVYIEGGIYTEDISINNFANLTLQGSANGSASVLAGAVDIQNSSNFSLYNFVFEQAVGIADSQNISIVGTDNADEIEVTLAGDVENLSVDGAAGDDSITINQNADSSGVIVDGGEGEDELAVNATDGDDQIIQEPDRVTINAVQMVVLSDVEKTLVDGGLGADQTTMTGEFILDDSSDFKVDLNGPALALYDHVSVIGAVDLNNATLSLNLGYKPTTGDTFVIIDNQDAPVSGTFSDLPEGAEFYVDGTKFSITYFGGVDSNDVILVDALDFGDAPSPYPTTLAEDGARHDTSAGPTLGLNRDSEADGTHSATASGDDTTGTPDDEDGVTFGTISVGQIGASITVNVQGGTGKLDAWIDFNGDGSWYSVGEQIADSLTVSAGDNTITFNVPAEAIDGNVYGRFRLSTAGGLAPTGAAPDGEVEDYQLAISPPSGSGQLVDNGQTLTSQNTVREVLEIAKE